MAARKQPNFAFEEECRRSLLAIAGAYAKAKNISTSTVSRDFYGHASFLKAFKSRSKTITLARLQTLLGQFAARWPEGLDWPPTSPLFVPGIVGSGAPKGVDGAKKIVDANPL